jgi:V8-like Glu-specific endopeptidase
MPRNALLCTALLAACGSSAKTTIPGPELGTSTKGTDPSAPSKPAAPAADPALAFRQAFADPGGMWMPSQMTLPAHVENFRKMGVAIPATTLADPLTAPLAAVVHLNGCTGSFVSSTGLVVTNHHCVQSGLQQNSTKDNNLVENGFLAKTLADEPSAGPSQRVMVVQAYRDVTKEMRDGLESITDPVARKEESEKRQKQLIAACEKDRPWLRCQVSSFFRGDSYQLIEMLEIKDVRLVYAPKRSVGNYGGEVDNWEWPRHTGDWSFYRAYVGKDGKPAEYSPDNVPYKPAHWLKVSTAGLKPADFVMVTGYPGRTERTSTAAEVHHDVEWYMPYYIAYSKERYAIAEKHLSDVGFKATTMKQSVQNYLEKYEGILAGVAKGNVLQQKDDLDKRVRAWAAEPGHEQYAAAIAKLDQVLAEQFRTARADFDRRTAFGGSKLLGNALAFVHWADERAKPDAERKPGYQDRDMPLALGSQKAFLHSYDRTLDRDSFRLTLVRAMQLDDNDKWLRALLGVKPKQKLDEALIDKTLDRWYKATKLEDEKLRLQLLEKGTLKQLKASKDPFVQAAVRVWPIYKANEKIDDARAGEKLVTEPYYAAALREVLGGALSPDANSTLRITYGTVKPLAADASPFTTASQILAKNTGTEPFDAPAAELELIKAKKYGPYADPALGGELPVDFLSDLDITNGNSGSPVLDDKGELVGLAFDGNKEGVASDVVFNPTTTRTIQVDARYMLWVMDALDGADRLLEEMGIAPALP